MSCSDAVSIPGIFKMIHCNVLYKTVGEPELCAELNLNEINLRPIPAGQMCSSVCLTMFVATSKFLPQCILGFTKTIPENL